MGPPSQQHVRKRVDTMKNPEVVQHKGQAAGGVHYGEEIFGGSREKKKAIWGQ